MIMNHSCIVNNNNNNNSPSHIPIKLLITTKFVPQKYKKRLHIEIVKSNTCFFIQNYHIYLDSLYRLRAPLKE